MPAKPDAMPGDGCLPEKDKLKALQNLEADQTALLRADDENMTRYTQEPLPSPAVMIQNIQRAERKLDCENHGTSAKS